MFYRYKVLPRNWLASVQHLWHSFCQCSFLNELLYTLKKTNQTAEHFGDLWSLYISFSSWMFSVILRLPKFLAKNIKNCAFDELRFPYCLRLNTYSPYCGVFKFYFNLHIVHVAIKLFQDNVVRGAEIFPSIRICFYELPEVWCRLAIAKKG